MDEETMTCVGCGESEPYRFHEDDEFLCSACKRASGHFEKDSA